MYETGHPGERDGKKAAECYERAIHSVKSSEEKANLYKGTFT